MVLLELTIVHSLAADWATDGLRSRRAWHLFAIDSAVVRENVRRLLTLAQRCASIAIDERFKLCQVIDGLARAGLHIYLL